LGRLDHKPPNPGLPEADYKYAFRAAANTNLAKGSPTLTKGVDTWMFDSNPSNIDRLGHRRWCISPYLRKTGLARTGSYLAMWTSDKSQKVVPDFDFLSFPPAGYMPTSYFSAQHAWNVSLNSKRYRKPDAAAS